MNRGFTVIELIIVIMIIAVIGAIAIPSLKASRDRAREKKAAEHGISYAIKNQPTYMVELACSNCKRTHVVEYTVGRPVTTDHKCPGCGCETDYAIRAKRPESTQ
jgi:prepilin-type N-terminal cleavage/methylation domain-containing protein